MMDTDGTVIARNSQNTILAELRFGAWLTEDGTRHIELARAQEKGPSPAINGGTAHS